MTDSPNRSQQTFTDRIYNDLDTRLRLSAFDGGAAEAHGQLVGLACRGISEQDLEQKQDLFRLSSEQELELLQGLFGLIEKDLNSDGFNFQPLLPPEDVSLFERTEAVASWCQGFIHGLCHDGEEILSTLPSTMRESVTDIIEISHAEVSVENNDNEHALFEIIEYLRVSCQLIFEQLNPYNNLNYSHHEC